MYIGSAPQERSFETLGKMENVRISYNLMEEIGWEGIEVKVGVRNVRIYRNVVHRTGTAGRKPDSAGIKLVASIGDVYNNFIATDCTGIKMGRNPETRGTRYYNNVVVGAKCSGIDVPEDGALVFNNTIVSSEPHGISATGAGSKIFNNIVAGTSGIPILGNGENIFNNFEGPISAAGFVNPEAEDYRLLPLSPAIEAGENIGAFPTFDMDGTRRPFGRSADFGAYEYRLPESHINL
jgi:hypothetical protein